MKTLTELFDNPVKYKTMMRGSDFTFYNFTVGDQDYQMKISMNGADSTTYEIGFINLTKTSIEVTGTGNASQVFATVIKITKDFIKKKKPKTIIFSGKGESRLDLYTRMVKIVAKGYKLSKVKEGGQMWFYLNKK